MSSQVPDPARDVALPQLLAAAVERKASDLYVTVGAPPSLRIDGEMFPLEAPALSPRDTARLCQNRLSEHQVERFAASDLARKEFDEARRTSHPSSRRGCFSMPRKSRAFCTR